MRASAFGHSVPRKNREKYNLYKTWTKMIDRCFNPQNPQFKNYGGRGIFVCARWINSFSNFFKDMGNKPEPNSTNKHRKYSIHRINNDGWYSPDNCKWADSAEQSRNRRKPNRNKKCPSFEEFVESVKREDEALSRILYGMREISDRVARLELIIDAKTL
jgi:hypothetical protein